MERTVFYSIGLGINWDIVVIIGIYFAVFIKNLLVAGIFISWFRFQFIQDYLASYVVYGAQTTKYCTQAYREDRDIRNQLLKLGASGQDSTWTEQSESEQNLTKYFSVNIFIISIFTQVDVYAPER